MYSVLRQRRALDVRRRLQLTRQPSARLRRDGLLSRLRQALDDRRVGAQVRPRTDEHERRPRRSVAAAAGARTPSPDLRYPLFGDVVERRRRDDAEADDEDVRLRVGERPQAVVLRLTGSVEEGEQVRFAAGVDRHLVVVEDRRDVVFRKAVRRVRHDEARLADASVADDDAFDRLHRASTARDTVVVVVVVPDSAETRPRNRLPNNTADRFRWYLFFCLVTKASQIKRYTKIYHTKTTTARVEGRNCQQLAVLDL